MRIARLLPLLLLLSACGSSPDDVKRVDYRVDGTATSVAITYANSTGGTSQITTNTPWTYQFQEPTSGQFLYVSAQNQNETGTVHVSISKDGTLYRESTSSGAFAIASADGTY